MSNGDGCLFVVATPIGNLGDITARAVETLRSVDLVAAEDTRHTGRLLRHLSIDKPLLALHDHNETAMLDRVVAEVASGRRVALVSDAGTPLISDPGFPLVRRLREEGLPVVPIPGPSALITALSGSGMSTARFCFHGFLPRKAGERRRVLEKLADSTVTQVFYESSHRVVDCLRAMRDVLGAERQATLARELTKLHETFLKAPLGDLLYTVEKDEDQRRGEFVLIVDGAAPPGDDDGIPVAVDHLLRVLLRELPVKRAAAIAAELTGGRKNTLYSRALEISGKE